MRIVLLGLGLLFIALYSHVSTAQSSSNPQPSTCITSQFSTENNVDGTFTTLRLINYCDKAVDLQNATIRFENISDLNTNFWGGFGALNYPDNELKISTQPLSNGNFLSTLYLHFPTHTNAVSVLPIGDSIRLKYKASIDNHIEKSALIYLNVPAERGTLILKNISKKPTSIVQSYAVIHLFFNNQKLKTIHLPWDASLIISNLAAGQYNLAADAITDNQDRNYQPIVPTDNFELKSKQIMYSNIQYKHIRHNGMIKIQLEKLPAELSDYKQYPSVLLTAHDGSSRSQIIPWEKIAVIKHLKLGTSYEFFAAPISYNGHLCHPEFTLSELEVTSEISSTQLKYTCIQTKQVNALLQVTGASNFLSRLQTTLTSQDGTDVITIFIPLLNGKGSQNILLTEGENYTISTKEIRGFSTSYTLQPFTAIENATETISLVPIGR